MMKSSVALLAVMIAASPLGAALQDPVATQTGLVAGRPGRDASLTVFKGIPFAAPPVGELRWRAPQPAAKWAGIRQADKFGPSPIQRIVVESKPWTHEFMTHGEISEDCLYLNVWTPAKTPGERLPVFVYVYGGANTEGSGAVAVYDGEGLARKGLVVVTFNYRVGVLGFFIHPELSKESGYNGSGNYGLHDQIAALKWVQANIAAFGGDPGKVTLAGQSAGASNIAALTTSPLAKGLFHRAILHSSPSNGLAANRRSADQEAQGVAYGEARGARSLAELRAMTWQQVIAAPPPPPVGQAPAAGRGGNTRFSPVIDGHVLTGTATEILAQRGQVDVPTLGGTTAKDSGGGPTQSLQWAKTRSAASQTPSYAYYFTHVMPGPDAAQYGAFHTSDVPYALNTLSMSDRPFAAADHKVADQMSSYWVNFAKTGNPNGPGLAVWKTTAESPDMLMELGDHMGMIVPPVPPVPAAPAAAPAAPAPAAK